MSDKKSTSTFSGHPRCAQCVACCSELLAAVTHHDVRRLVRKTGIPAEDFVRFYAPADLDCPPEDSGWIRLARGRRMLGLKRTEQGCIFLSPSGLCAAYAARPMLCRTFPFEFMFDREAGATSRLRTAAADGTVDCPAYSRRSRPGSTESAVAEQEHREREEYNRLVRIWNARRDRGSREEFLAFLGRSAAAGRKR